MSQTLTIDHLAHRGDGVALLDDKQIYVPLTLPGETVEVERKGERVRLISIETASPQRVEALCRHFGTCGGCALQHMERTAYDSRKEKQVTAALASRGLEREVLPIVPASPAHDGAPC
ncbi:hypothetical protein [Breoghania sp.]|uniref:hypothetical protein n=1 Tax=Breoghania sp. TaxID=2065378 RepID=UPI00261CD44C|nr:hypothetical protein [Breoghania sp.]MDJ0932369.1 hypothetical protein [Breoghania sp.]